MIRDAPVKFRIMEVFEEGGPQWNYEVVPKIMEEYGMHSHHEQQMVNYDIIEMVSAGFLEEGGEVQQRTPPHQVHDHSLGYRHRGRSEEEGETL